MTMTWITNPPASLQHLQIRMDQVQYTRAHPSSQMRQDHHTISLTHPTTHKDSLIRTRNHCRTKIKCPTLITCLSAKFIAPATSLAQIEATLAKQMQATPMIGYLHRQRPGGTIPTEADYSNPPHNPPCPKRLWFIHRQGHLNHSSGRQEEPRRRCSLQRR